MNAGVRPLVYPNGHKVSFKNEIEFKEYPWLKYDANFGSSGLLRGDLIKLCVLLCVDSVSSCRAVDTEFYDSFSKMREVDERRVWVEPREPKAGAHWLSCSSS